MQKTDESTDPGVLAAATCHEPFAEAWTELGDGVEHALIGVLKEGTERHRALLASVELDGEPPEDPAERTRRLLEYRGGLDTEVLKPLARTFEHRGPSAIVDVRLQKAAKRAVELTAELPEKVVAPWPDDALARRDTDPLRRRVGKVLARVVSAARKSGRERALPLRSVALDHLADVTLPGQDEMGGKALHTWAEWSRRLETLWADWGRDALPKLVRAELAPEDDDEWDPWTPVRDAALALQAGLEELLEQDPRSALAEWARGRLGEAQGALQADLAVAGSFLVRPSGDTPQGRLPRTAALAPAAKAWDEGVGARLHLHLALLALLSGASAVRERLVYRFRQRCLADIAVLSEAAERLEAAEAEIRSSLGDGPLRSHLDELDEQVEKVLAPTLHAVPEQEAIDTAVREISESTVEALLAMIRQTPTELVLHSLAAKPAGLTKVETRAVPLQELARQAFDALRMERIRSSTEGLIDALDTARTGVAELDKVFAFARDEASRELEEGGSESNERAADLVGGALHSIAEALRTQRANLEAAVVSAQNKLTGEISQGSGALLERVGAGRVEARLFAARSRAADLRAWVVERWGPAFDRGSRWAKVRLARLRRLSERLLKKGSSIVGSTPSGTAASSRTLRALADMHELTEHLPLVYQRLFTLEPLSDGALMAGREAMLSEALGRWRAWSDRDGVPLIVRGRQGSGITSFLNVFRLEIESDEGSVVSVSLDDRVPDEAALAGTLAAALELPAVDSLDRLAREVFAATPADMPDAVALDNLEHLYLRVPGGTDLIERLFTLMAETEPRVFWFGGITASAWQLVATAEPTAIAQVDALELRPLSSEALQDAIMLRHRRSGLAIRYEEPTAGRHLLRRRLRRMRKAEDYQGLLEDDFFDRLHKASGGHLGLALWQWLMAADFESGEGVLMHQPERPDFSLLEALDLTQNFTLKAFLEHRSLTLDEHDRIFRLPRHESYQIFESLRNRHVLEPVAVDDSHSIERSEIEEELRYRVRPLLTGAVITHLQGRNIVH